MSCTLTYYYIPTDVILFVTFLCYVSFSWYHFFVQIVEPEMEQTCYAKSCKLVGMLPHPVWTGVSIALQICQTTPSPTATNNTTHVKTEYNGRVSSYFNRVLFSSVFTCIWWGHGCDSFTALFVELKVNKPQSHLFVSYLTHVYICFPSYSHLFQLMCFLGLPSGSPAIINPLYSYNKPSLCIITIDCVSVCVCLYWL